MRLGYRTCFHTLYDEKKKRKKKKKIQMIIHIILKLVHKKVPSTKEDLLMTIKESWNHFDKEYYFEFMTAIPVVKA